MMLMVIGLWIVISGLVMIFGLWDWTPRRQVYYVGFAKINLYVLPLFYFYYTITHV